MGRFGSTADDVSSTSADRAGEGSALRVLIIDDHTLFSEVLKRALEGQGIDVVGLALTGKEGIHAVRHSCPEVAFVDLGLPDLSGLAVGQAILETCPEIKVVALTAIEDPRTVKEALRVGFHGYVTKYIPVQRLIQALDSVLGGHVVVPQRLASEAAEARNPEDEAVELLAKQLTPREREVLVLLVEGASGQMIARRLGISPNTVRTHVQSILMKLQVHSRLQAATFAVRHRLVAVPGEIPALVPNSNGQGVALNKALA